MTKFRKLLETSGPNPDPTPSVQPQWPRTHAVSPQIPEKVLIAPRKKTQVQLQAAADIPGSGYRPKKISAQAYRLAPIYCQTPVDPQGVVIPLEISAAILEQAQQILARAEDGSLSALVESLLTEWVKAQEDEVSKA